MRSVGRPGNLSTVPSKGNRFLLSTMFKPAMGPTPPHKMVNREILHIKHVADQPPPPPGAEATQSFGESDHKMSYRNS
jgi:hypothetical protein